MKIKVNEKGQIRALEDAQLVANAAGFGVNNIDLYFAPETTLKQDVTTVNFAVTRADGFTILNLRGELTTENIDASFGASCYRYTVTENDGVLGVSGALQVSAQVLHIELDEAGVISDKQIIATVTCTAHVLENIGTNDIKEYNAIMAYLDGVEDAQAALNAKQRKILEIAAVMPTFRVEGNTLYIKSGAEVMNENNN